MMELHLHYALRALLFFSLGYRTAASISFPPAFYKQPPPGSEIFLIANQRYLLECEASGNPAPKYQWFKDGFPFQGLGSEAYQLPDKGTLVIVSANIKHTGQYQCKATNALGTIVSNVVKVEKAGFTSIPKLKPVLKLVANEGEPLSLRCESPDGKPKPIVAWMVQKGREGAIRRINDTRRTVDPNGHLHFSNITADDLSDNSLYICAAFVPFLKTDIKITDRVSLELKKSQRVLVYKPEEQHVSPTSINVLRGDTVEIHCIFGGTPLPKIIWKRLNGELPPDRHKYLNFGKTLQLQKVDFVDNGTYGCRAESEFSEPEHRAFHLNIRAAPYWISEPNNTYAGDGDNIRFECKAGGVPEPKIQWLVNGQPMSISKSKPRLRLLNPTTVAIENVDKSDTAVYQCKAINPYGEIYSNFFINVIEKAPEMMEGPQKSYDAAEGGSIILSCRVFGAPKPEVTWIRTGKTLHGGRYTVFDSGDLKIENVLVTDAGRYQCIARNKYGNVRSDINVGLLNVKEKTRITSKPRNHRVRMGDSVTFYCNATTDKTRNFTIDWMKNDEFIDYNSDWHFIKASDNSLTIISIDKFHSGKYSCVASTTLDNARANATLLVQDIPNPPKIVKTDCFELSALINWQQQGDNNAPIITFKVQYNNSFSPDEWKTNLPSIPSSAINNVVVRLFPWANYTFRVLAVNEIGSSLPSETSETCTMGPSIPPEHPKNIKGNGTTPTNLVISWMPIPLLHQGGPGFFYKVYYRLADSDNKQYTVVNIHDWRQNSITVENQPTFQKYYIKVISYNSIGTDKSLPEGRVVGYSGEDVPRQEPGNFKLVRVVDSTSAEFSWNPVPASSLRGHFRGFKVQTWTTSEDDLKEHILQPSTRIARVTGLKPYTRYNARLLAFNEQYNGPPTPVITFHTQQGVPSHPESFTATPLGKTSLYFRWKKPTSPNGILTGYNIYYSKISGTKRWEDRKLSVPDPRKTSVKLSNLDPDTQYKAEIRAITYAGEGNLYGIETKTGVYSAFPTKPNFIWYQLPLMKETAIVKVIWRPDIHGTPGSHFYIQYRKKGSEQWAATTMEMVEDSLQIDLEHGVKYEVRVVSVDGDYEMDSDTQEVETINVKSVVSDWPRFSKLIDRYCTSQDSN